MDDSKLRFSTDFHVRAPLALVDAVTRAADKNMTTSSEYIRQAIISRLKNERVLPVDDGLGA
jgi:hypothetical protein